MDVPTLEKLVASPSHSRKHLNLFLPLNTKRSLPSSMLQKYAVHEFDWWESAQVTVENVGKVRVTSTPAQHFTGRGLFDRDCSLWSSWAFEGLEEGVDEPSVKVWFGGDTGKSLHHLLTSVAWTDEIIVTQDIVRWAQAFTISIQIFRFVLRSRKSVNASKALISDSFL